MSHNTIATLIANLAEAVSLREEAVKDWRDGDRGRSDARRNLAKADERFQHALNAYADWCLVNGEVQNNFIHQLNRRPVWRVTVRASGGPAAARYHHWDGTSIPGRSISRWDSAIWCGA